MSKSGAERYIVAVIGGGCGLLWGYTIPMNMHLHWGWRLLAIPAALIIGGAAVVPRRDSHSG